MSSSEQEGQMGEAKTNGPELELPGFRFHPTEEELLNFYLRKIATGKKLHVDIIGFLNIYHHDPWELPGLARIGEREWYFFVHRDRKHGHGGRPNRTTEHGFWKATGSDRPIRCLSDPKNILGLRKTLVFYKGRAPRGSKTDWVMNEYRLLDNCTSPKEDIVLCKIYRKATSLKVLEQRAAMEEKSRVSSPTKDTNTLNDVVLKTEEFEEEEKDQKVHEGKVSSSSSSSSSSSPSSSLIGFGSVKENLTELEVPKFTMDWTMDPLWTQLRSPWLDNWMPYADVLNF